MRYRVAVRLELHRYSLSPHRPTSVRPGCTQQVQGQRRTHHMGSGFVASHRTLGGTAQVTLAAAKVAAPNLPTTCTGHSGFIAAVSNVLTLCP